MALNLATLKTRSLTAVVFVAVMLAGLLWNFWSFLILFTVVHFGCWIEYLKLAEKIYNTTIDNFVKWFFAVCGYTLMIVAGIQHNSFDIGTTIGGYDISFKWLFFILLFAGLTIFAVQNKMIPTKTKWMVFGGFVYISMPIMMMIHMRSIWSDFEGFKTHTDFGSTIPIAIILSIWINDTMAYIVGSLIGKTPFSKISPKKTWEGTIGGAILAVLVIGFLFPLLADKYFYPFSQHKHWFVIAALCAIFGTIGDLFESKLKRMANVKDSGAIMPGHGGFLDRFDSLLFAAPAVWLFVKLFM